MVRPSARCDWSAHVLVLRSVDKREGVVAAGVQGHLGPDVVHHGQGRRDDCAGRQLALALGQSVGQSRSASLGLSSRSLKRSKATSMSWFVLRAKDTSALAWSNLIPFRRLPDHVVGAPKVVLSERVGQSNEGEYAPAWSRSRRREQGRRLLSFDRHLLGISRCCGPVSRVSRQAVRRRGGRAAVRWAP